MEFRIEDRASRLFYHEKGEDSSSIMAIRNKATVHIQVISKRQGNNEKFTKVLLNF